MARCLVENHWFCMVCFPGPNHQRGADARWLKGQAVEEHRDSLSAWLCCVGSALGRAMAKKGEAGRQTLVLNFYGMRLHNEFASCLMIG